MRTRIPTIAAVLLLVPVSAGAFCLLSCPTLPPSAAVVTKLSEVIPASDRPAREIEECKAEFRGRLERVLKEGFRETGDETLIDGVVSVYLNDQTFDPFSCRVHSLLLTRTLRDIHNRYFYDARTALVQALYLNNDNFYNSFDDTVDNVAESALVLAAKCKPQFPEAAMVENADFTVYCQFGDGEFITYGFVFKVKLPGPS
jgi:hypothetical protein